MRCKDCGGEIRDDEVVLVSNVCPECERRRADG